jgi:hypothetical protein
VQKDGRFEHKIRSATSFWERKKEEEEEEALYGPCGVLVEKKHCGLSLTIDRKKGFANGEWTTMQLLSTVSDSYARGGVTRILNNSQEKHRVFSVWTQAQVGHNGSRGECRSNSNCRTIWGTVPAKFIHLGTHVVR